jgi:hypothetical protein
MKTQPLGDFNTSTISSAGSLDFLAFKQHQPAGFDQ